MEPDLGRWFIAGSLRRSWWGSGGRGDCRGTAPKVWKKPWHQVLHPGRPAPACICATLQRDSRLLGKASSGDVCTDCEGHHTNTSMRDCLGHHARALPARQPPQEPAPGAVVPVLGSPKLEASAVHAPEVSTETFLVLLPLLQLCPDLCGLVTASKSVPFLTALWRLLSPLSSTESQCELAAGWSHLC